MENPSAKAEMAMLVAAVGDKNAWVVYSDDK
jgi:hypothetical protein